jgi:hypothetical protein
MRSLSPSDARPTRTSAAAPAKQLEVGLRFLVGETALESKGVVPNEPIPVESRFELTFPSLTDVRVRLFDEEDRQVPSTDRLEAGEKIRYLLTPAEALSAGSRYQLLVDGLTSDQPTDRLGQAYDPVRIEILTAGEKPPKKALPKKTSRKRARKG